MMKSMKIASSFHQIEKYYLNRSLGLANLFENIESKPIFVIPENSIVVSQENITFGPTKYTVLVQDNTDIYFRVLYYSILYFLFEVSDKKNKDVFQKKLIKLVLQKIDSFLLSENDSLWCSTEDVKVYFVKFIQILKGRRHENKLLVEELRRLPQIDKILLIIIKTICDQEHQFQFQKDKSQVQKKLKTHLDLEFQLLDRETIIFQKEFKVSIREYNDSFEFNISKQSIEQLDAIKIQYNLAKTSAFFSSAEIAAPIRQSKVERKSTIKSVEIQLVENASDQDSQKFEDQNESTWIFRHEEDSKEINLNKPQGNSHAFQGGRFDYNQQAPNSQDFNYFASNCNKYEKPRELNKNFQKIFKRKLTKETKESEVKEQSLLQSEKSISLKSNKATSIQTKDNEIKNSRKFLLSVSSSPELKMKQMKKIPVIRFTYQDSKEYSKRVEERKTFLTRKNIQAYRIKFLYYSPIR